MDAPVVVGYDASPESTVAVRWAAREASRRGVALDVVHVWGFAGEPRGGAGSGWLGEKVAEAVHAVADEGADAGRAQAPGLEVTGVVAYGSPAQALVDRAATAALLVVARSGTGRSPTSMVGSVAAGVLAHAPCPVVCVPASTDLDAGRRSVVVGLDGSPGSTAALAEAVEIADGAPLTVVTTWTPITETTTLTYWATAYPDSSPDQVAAERAERVQEQARDWVTERFPDVEVSWVVERGRAGDVLVELSRHAGLTVIGARGRGGLASLLLGSVSRSVVRRAHGPVLVTRTRPEAGAQ